MACFHGNAIHLVQKDGEGDKVEDHKMKKRVSRILNGMATNGRVERDMARCLWIMVSLSM